jgi:colicin import membrane protein
MMAGRKEPGRIRAGILAVAVHLVFLGLLVFGVSWQSRESAPVVAELWSHLPAPPPPAPAPRSEPRPAPEPAPEPKPKPEPRVEPKPAKADIELKAKQQKEAKRKEELKRREEERKEQEKAKRLQEQKELQARLQAEEELIRQQRRAAEEAARQQAAAARVEADYIGRITAKVKQYLNRQPCLPLGNPEALYEVRLMPTGQLLVDPRLKKTSGNAQCDQAIERAILRAQPLPLPPDPALFDRFRELELKFRPNE